MVPRELHGCGYHLGSSYQKIPASWGSRRRQVQDMSGQHGAMAKRSSSQQHQGTSPGASHPLSSLILRPEGGWGQQEEVVPPACILLGFPERLTLSPKDTKIFKSSSSRVPARSKESSVGLQPGALRNPDSVPLLRPYLATEKPPQGRNTWVSNTQGFKVRKVVKAAPALNRRSGVLEKKKKD